MEIKRFEAKFPSILPPEGNEMFSTGKKLELLFRSLKGYILYYAVMSDGTWGGHCFLKRDYLKRYGFMDKNDLIITPYYTTPSLRGRGIAQQIIAAAISESANAIWAMVVDTNSVSLHVLKKAGFKEVGFGNAKGWRHPISENKDRLYVLKYCREWNA